MTEDDIVQFVPDQREGVHVVVASEHNGALEVSWGDTFFFYDPDRSIPQRRRFPFATIVTKDYEGFDEASVESGRSVPAQHVDQQADVSVAVRRSAERRAE